MRTRLFAALSLCLILSATGRPGAQSSSRMTLVKANRLLDPRTGNVLSPAAVLIEERKIKEVGAPTQIERSAPAGAVIIDLGNAMLLPGLVDSHTHLFLDIILPPEAEMQRHYNSCSALGELLAIVESPAKRAFLGAQMAREDLESGSTTVRNLGHSGIDGDTELRDAINAGRITGPRILAAGRKLITRGGHHQHLKVAVHAIDAPSIQTAPPTSYGVFFQKVFEPIVRSPAALAARTASSARDDRRYDELVGRVLKSGVKFSAGSDMDWLYAGKTRGEASVNSARSGPFRRRRRA